MYKLIATEDFVNVLCELPLKHLPFIIHSFVSIEKLDATEEGTLVPREDISIIEMLEQFRAQKIE